MMNKNRAEVFLLRLNGEKGEELNAKIRKLLKELDFFGLEKGDFTGIKIHWGEEGNTGFIPSYYYKELVSRIRACGGKPFFTDTTTLYRTQRYNGLDGTELAYKHGFDYQTVGVPVIIGDGIKGRDFYEVEVNFKQLDKVKIATIVKQADYFIIASHFKGHMLAGFGGALKNVYMGFPSRSHKQKIHSNVKPAFTNVDKCTGCGTCVNICPANAIKIVDNKADFDHKKCWGCGECIVICPEKALKIQWKTDSIVFFEKAIETAKTILDEMNKPPLFINFLLNIVPDCDCMSHTDPPLVPDVGIVASMDPVAIDQASIDLVNQSDVNPDGILAGKAGPGDDKIAAYRPNIPWKYQLKYAEEMGVGVRTYDLVEVK
ncbi:DUF362 domain-containing protein [bacterium]|nr:DUF362 domain-containing protein [bacterium]